MTFGAEQFFSRKRNLWPHDTINIYASQVAWAIFLIETDMLTAFLTGNIQETRMPSASSSVFIILQNVLRHRSHYTSKRQSRGGFTATKLFEQKLIKIFQFLFSLNDRLQRGEREFFVLINISKLPENNLLLANLPPPIIRVLSPARPARHQCGGGG